MPDPNQNLLLDIEGTTTPIRFVYDVLFPYARRYAETFLREHQEEPEVESLIEAFRLQSATDRAEGREALDVPRRGADAIRSAVLGNAIRQMDEDRKVTCLKALQGRIWRAGYESGQLKGALFEDVVPALSRWQASGRRTFIYSSGSVEAQELLFRYSEQGDLTPYLSGYFDTMTGPKKEADSYVKICRACGVKSMLFATDILGEAQAAASAGLDVVLMRRPGNSPLEFHSFREAETFDDL